MVDDKLKRARHWIQREARGEGPTYTILALEALADAIEELAGKREPPAAPAGSPPARWSESLAAEIRELLPWAEGNHDGSKTCDCDRCLVTRHARGILASYEAKP